MRRVAWLSAFLFAACSATGNGEQDGAAASPDAPAAGVADRATARALHYTADLRVMESFPVQLGARMQVHNPLDRTAALEAPGGCPLHILAWRDSARTQLAWDQGHAIACTLQIQLIELAPNQQHEFTAATNAREILGDSLPDGLYYMTARLAVNDTMIMRPVGSVQLAVPR